MKTWSMLPALLLLPSAVLAQENVRQVEGPGKYTKHLTTGQLDSWIFDGEKGETIIAHVTSREFDPILELARKDEKEDKVLLAVDDEGGESRFSMRLPEKGEYKIRIHAFKYQGGGNYALQIRRFRATPLEVGKPLVGTFDREGKSYHYFQGAADQILIPELKGTSSDSREMLDAKGRPMRDWFGTVLTENDGEHSLVASGAPGNRYQLVIREARRRNLEEGRNLTGRLQQGEMDVWSLTGKPGDFRLLEVKKEGRLASRLVYAPPTKKKEQRIAAAGDRPEIQFIPVASKGDRLRFAAVFGREGRYQLHVLARTAASYSLQVKDPTVPIAPGKETEGSLPVGGSAFYGFRASPGQLFQTSLASEKFDPFLRLYDFRGNPIAANNDGGGGLGSRITHMTREEGLYRLQVSSLGDGGGGKYQLLLREEQLKELQLVPQITIEGT